MITDVVEHEIKVAKNLEVITRGNLANEMNKDKKPQLDGDDWAN